MLLTPFLLCAVLLLLLWTWQNREPLRLYLQLGSCYTTVPVVEHLLRLIGDKEHAMKLLQTAGKHALASDGVSSYWLLHRLYAVVADAGDANLIIKHQLEKDELMTKMCRLFLGDSLIFAPVSIWRPRRKAIVTLFSHSNVLNFQPIFAQNSRLLVDKLRQKVGQGVFCVHDYCNALNFDTSCKVILGLDLSSLNDPSEPLRTAINFILDNMFNVLLYLPGRIKFLRKMSSWRALGRRHKAVICQHVVQALLSHKAAKESKEATDEKHNGEVVSLLSLNERTDGRRLLGHKELREEAVLLLLAAIDTTSASLASTILMLAWHPDVQEKAYQEVNEVFGESDRLVTAEDLPRLKYLEAVLRETQRLLPPAPVIARQTSSDVTLHSGVNVPKGTNILIHIWAVNRNPKYWGADAEEFRPERFLEGPELSAFLTFSCGSRGCPGMQYATMLMKSALAELLRRYRVLPPLDATAHHSLDSLRLLYNGTMRAEQYPIRLALRNTN